MLSEQETTRLKKWTSKFFENNDKGFDSFDFINEIDKNLNYEENKAILREKLKLFFHQFSESNILNMKKSEAENIGIAKQQSEILIQQAKQEQEQQARIEFYNSLEKIGKQKETLLLEQKFYLLRQFVKMVCNGNATGLIVEGEAGLGKSYNILKCLQESKKEFIYCSGFTTSLEFYNFLYENREKIIFFDDIKNIFKNETSLELLKASMFSVSGTRILRYLSNTPKLKAPFQFIFNGGVIFAVNDLNNRQSEDLKAVIDRILHYNVKFSYFEKLEILCDLIKQDYKELKSEDRQFIFNWIKNNTNEATSNLNFRLLFKLYEIFRYNKEDFNKLARELIKKDEQKELILTLLQKSSSVKQAEQQYCEQTGFSGRYFYKLKAKITA